MNEKPIRYLLKTFWSYSSWILISQKIISTYLSNCMYAWCRFTKKATLCVSKDSKLCYLMGWCVSILAREFGKRGITWRFHLENGVWHGQFSETFLCRIQLLNTVNQNWKFRSRIVGQDQEQVNMVQKYQQFLWIISEKNKKIWCSSGFPRLPQLDKISLLIWQLLSNFDITLEISLHFCGLLRKSR